jgi:methyl-accepting chemotaxis protein
MKTSIKKRLLRLGILCAGVAAFAVMAFSSVAINIIETNFAQMFGTTVVNSVVNSLQEECEYLPNGLREAVPGEPNDIFDDVFILGDSKSYNYSTFISESQKLSANGVNIGYISSANLYLVALNRGSDIIVGSLESGYFDYATDIMKANGTYGYFVNNSDGRILLATNKGDCGGSVSGNAEFGSVLTALKSGKSASSGGALSKNVVFSAPLPDNSEFGVIFVSDSSVIYRGGKVALIAIIAWAAILTMTGVIVSIGVAKKITASIVPTVECLEKFSHGEIDNSFKANDREDETQILSQAMEKTINNLGAYIHDIDYMLSEIANGNLAVESRCEYEGDFNSIKSSLNNIADSLKSTIAAIREAGAQVNSGVETLAGGAQSLADNSTTEAGTLKELDTLVQSINENVSANAEMTDRMRGLSEKTVDNVRIGNDNMKNLSSAIEDIRKASEEIQTIAKLIDDIAFQTNILALNAAVEAARAGDAGKGFAVVADEVRNLASKSAEAAKDAVQVIGRCVAAVDEGVKLNQSASQSLEQVSESVEEFSILVGKVADSSSRQARDISTVNNGLTSITSVVQSNAATAEESAASSEELASQAQVLENRLRGFRIE